MLPVRYLEDLKTAPIDKVDFVATFQEVTFTTFLTMILKPWRMIFHVICFAASDYTNAISKIFEGKYTIMGSRSTRVVKAQLNQHLCMPTTLVKRNTLLILVV